MVECKSELLNFVGTLNAHTDRITSLSTLVNPLTSENILLSASRDRKVILWKYSLDNFTESPGRAYLSLHGHSQAITGLAVAAKSFHAITSSADKTLRLWDLETGISVRRFEGHSKCVNSVALSKDDRQIISASSDKTIKLWNTIADCKYTITDGQHKDIISSVQFSPSQDSALVVSSGWDNLVKLWSLQNCKLKDDLKGHGSPVYSVTISPDGSLCASGGKDGTAILWDVNEQKHLYELDSGSCINTLCFSPSNYWLCAATDYSVKIWNLEDKHVLANISAPPSSDNKVTMNSKKADRSRVTPWAISLAWSADGNVLFVGASNGKIYVYELSKNENK